MVTSCIARTALSASVCIRHLISSTGVKTVETATPEAIAHATILWTGMVSFGPSWQKACATLKLTKSVAFSAIDPTNGLLMPW